MADLNRLAFLSINKEGDTASGVKEGEWETIIAFNGADNETRKQDDRTA